ncbi:hypothetical protein K402DRAFT_387967 [Aulographum hederae CBS 113979]|uniref:Uncharacterized protein n=1 Tax=Aulographum hederae CBS 113979 TaxID=1176131 RepID=A0A6G1HGW4_9PEZI|nr:hypothetical protein K402DRAFT_387967 [Aulographum hederae CBS 113979]
MVEGVEVNGAVGLGFSVGELCAAIMWLKAGSLTVGPIVCKRYLQRLSLGICCTDDLKS